MNAYFHYMVDSGLTLGVLTLIYLFFFRKETYFRFNRIYLLSAVMFSIIMPFVTIPGMPGGERVNGTFSVILDTVPVYTRTYTNEFSMILSKYGLVGMIYLCGVFLFLILFLVRLISLIRILQKAKLKHRTETISLMESREIQSPFSFFHFIVLPVNNEESTKLNSILAHENEHVRQHHSVDILILELLTAVQWYNPFIWLVRRLVRENHELLADRAVLSSGYSPNKYKLLLLSQVAGSGFLITNNFNYSLIKIRIRMMTKNKSSKYAMGRIGIGLIIAAGLLISLHLQGKTLNSALVASEITLQKGSVTPKMTDRMSVRMKSSAFGELTAGKDVAADRNAGAADKEQETASVRAGVEQMPSFPGGKEELQKFLARKLKYPPEAVAKGEEGTVVVAFVVTATGDLSDVKILHSVGKECDDEAIRLVNLMPKWEPGRQNGDVVPVQCSIPIRFFVCRE